MADHPALTAEEIQAIRARIGTETAKRIAEALGLHVSTIRRYTRGMKRAMRRDGYRRTPALMPSNETLDRCWGAACETIAMGQMPRT